MTDAISVVIPVRNGARWIADVIGAIAAQADGHEMEVIVVDDGSTDATAGRLARFQGHDAVRVRVLQGGGRGAAAALNLGIRAARFPLICQIDQDVTVGSDWLARLLDAVAMPGVAAAQGYYHSHPDADLCARAMNRDLEQRYASIAGVDTDHVCTGNTLYRAAALHAVGLFDESLGYGYDNDMSYRLRAAGYRLVLCRAAVSVHRWREGLSGYALQQYGFGYGRLDLLAKHPSRLAGDDVAPMAMMAHPVLLAVAALALALGMLPLGTPSVAFYSRVAALSLVVGLCAERVVAGVQAARQFRDPAPLLFPVLHLVRDAAWVAAIAVWVVRRMTGRAMRPAHSMRPRAGASPRGAAIEADRRAHPGRPRVLCVVPAHNEAMNLRAVVEELRACDPSLHILVVDDGSTDGTSALLEDLGVRYLRFPTRMGVGSGIRAALRYADHLRYDYVIRVDGDGQHRAAELGALIAPLASGEADVVLGSRYAGAAAESRRSSSVIQRVLAVCLSRVTGKRITDPTSGFCALGRSAIRLLAEHHPSGYAEPELRLFLSRNQLRVVEVPVRARPRLHGRTSLTPARLTWAAGRALLALVIVPLRRTVSVARD